MKSFRFALLPIVLTLILAFPVQAFAQGGGGGRVVFGGDFTLASGETMYGDLVVFGGNADLEAGSTVDGDVLVLGGNTTADGEITGNIVLVGGNIDLGSTAHVHGDVTTYGGNVSRAAGTQIDGSVQTGQSFSLPFNFEFGRSYSPQIGMLRDRLSFVGGFLWFIFRTLLLAALAVLVVMFWPQLTARTAEAIVGQPILAGGFGLLTLVIAPILLLMLLITIILSPVSFLGVILLVVAATFGWIALGLEVGERMATAFKWDLHPAAAAGLGTLILSFVLGGIGEIPCVGWIAPFLGISLGLGGVLLTRFGTRSYALAPAAPPPPPPPPPPAEEPEPPKRRRGGRSSAKQE